MSDLEAEEQMEVEEYRKKYIDALEKQGTEETFLQKYGYGYDWVFVFAIHEEPEEDIENFKKNQRKGKYAYLLTPKGIREKSILTHNFIKRKRKEYIELKNDYTLFNRTFILNFTDKIIPKKT